LASTPSQAIAGPVRGVPESGIKSLKIIADHVQMGRLDGFDTQEGIAIGARWRSALPVHGRRHGNARFAT
jgi:lipoprotein-releasing system permease protein